MVVQQQASVDAAGTGDVDHLGALFNLHEVRSRFDLFRSAAVGKLELAGQLEGALRRAVAEGKPGGAIVSGWPSGRNATAGAHCCTPLEATMLACIQ